ncbi:MAG: hypothetical protein LDL13_05785 [Calditerrivibrio sp.]|nr:hypothetical protein [Calditerrivibrio sp.]MCA1933068.1 hypothetical protein [Calditerrivibrio sp.]MCA1979989.1 hypothetical protein [Calditerrivibrio sp.]
MNYRVVLTGLHRPLLDLILKLLLVSFDDANYSIKLNSKFPENPFDPPCYEIILKGSEKNSFIDIYVDFDDVMLEKFSELSPSKLMINVDKDGKHYWYILGLLFKKIEDVSLAFVTGYLVDKKMDTELKNFRST